MWKRWLCLKWNTSHNYNYKIKEMQLSKRKEKKGGSLLENTSKMFMVLTI